MGPSSFDDGGCFVVLWQLLLVLPFNFGDFGN